MDKPNRHNQNLVGAIRDWLAAFGRKSPLLWFTEIKIAVGREKVPAFK